MTINPKPVANAGVDTNVCSGKTVIIGGSPSASSGTVPYTYSWDPSLGLSSSSVSNPGASPTVVTTYQLVVTDSKGCASSDDITVTPSPNPIADAGLDKSMVSCSADSVRLGASPTASGGTPGYTYSWSAPVTMSGSANPYVKNLGSDVIITLTVTDAIGCSATDQVFIAVTGSSLSAFAGNGASYCLGSSVGVQLGGSPVVIGGIPPYTFTWLPNTALSNSSSPNPIATPGVSTTYTLVVTDSKGCSATDTVRINVSPTPTANSGMDTAICSGSCVTIGASPTGLGGTGTLTYNWSPPSSFQTPTTGANPIVCPTGTTAYTVVVTDSLGCNASSTISVVVNPNPVVNAGQDQSITDCIGSSAILGGSPTATGGSGSYTYLWSPQVVGSDTVLNSTSIAHPVVTNLKSTTTFTLQVIDNVAGCSSTDQVVITVLPTSLVADAGIDKSICGNGATCVQIGGNPTAAGGQSPYTYQWSTSLGLNNANIANPCALPLATTTYQLEVTDNLGCRSFDSVTINVSPKWW
ncbi:MAG: hypothetical protein IPP77_00145 [Bacteroidetes bacterium]|nr:hypothetical protein [Bacteroidota bacterium]